jgi:septum formation protein
LGVKFSAAKSAFCELPYQGRSPSQYVRKNALGKAKEIAEKFQNAIVVGADTVVVLNTSVLGKPKDCNEAITFLTMLQGKKHLVYTGLAIIETSSNVVLTDFVKTKVVIRPLTLPEVKLYLNSIHPFDKAGAYAIQGAGSIIVEYIEGCYYNVVGFPIAKLEKMLQLLNISLFDYME